MVEAADELGQIAIGIADRNPFAGVVRAYDEAKNRNIKLMVGTRLVTTDGFEVLAYPTDRAAYGRLCRLLTTGNPAAKKGECHLTFEQILGASEGQMLIAIPPVSLFSLDMFPGRNAARSEAKWCAADPGSSETPSAERSWICDASLQSAFYDARKRVIGTASGKRISVHSLHLLSFPRKRESRTGSPPGGHPIARTRDGDPERGRAENGYIPRPPRRPRSRPRRGARFSPAFIIIAAMSRAGSVCWRSLAKRSARRSLRSTMCIINAPERRPLADVAPPAWARNAPAA